MNTDYIAVKAMVITAIEKKLKDLEISDNQRRWYNRDLDSIRSHTEKTALTEHDTDPAILQFINHRHKSLAKKFYFAYIHEKLGIGPSIKNIPLSDADILFMYRHYTDEHKPLTDAVRKKMREVEYPLRRGFGWTGEELVKGVTGWQTEFDRTKDAV